MNQQHELRPVAARYLLMADLLHMFLAALVLNTFLFVGTEVPWLFQLAIIALIMIVLVRGGVWLILGAMQVSMFFYETRANGTGVSLVTLIQALICLTMIAYAAGFRTVRRLLREWLGRLFQSLFEPVAPVIAKDAWSDLEARRDQLANTLWLREQLGSLLLRSGRLLLIVVLASLAMLRLPFSRSGIADWWERTVAMDYKLWPGPTPLLLALVCLVVLAYGSWRQLNPLQARLYIKSLYVREHFRELRSILVRCGNLTKPLQQSLKPTKGPSLIVSRKES